MKLKTEKQIEYLLKITDRIGLIEHCKYDQPNYNEGWCVDDNARALQVCLRYKQKKLDNVKLVYFNFLKSALKKDGLSSDLNKDLSWKKVIGFEGEHCGRALSALGETIKFDKQMASEAKKTFDKIYFKINKNNPVVHFRELAQIIIGLQDYHNNDIEYWADKIVDQYNLKKDSNWKWFEPAITYDNGRIPLSLLVAYQTTKNKKYLNVAIESLDFLTEKIINKKLKCFSFSGNKGWITKDGNRAIFDQQPIEAGSMVEVYVLAYKMTKKRKYKKLAETSMNWYFGKNISNVEMVDQKTGGVFDGLEKNKANLNRGAEALLSYLIAVKEIEKIID